jgi:hypothetical protein
VGGAISVSLVLSRDWSVSVLLAHISHWVLGPTETETSIPHTFSGLKSDVDTSFIKWSLYTVSLSCMEVFLKSVFGLCQMCPLPQ